MAGEAKPWWRHWWGSPPSPRWLRRVEALTNRDPAEFRVVDPFAIVPPGFRTRRSLFQPLLLVTIAFIVVFGPLASAGLRVFVIGGVPATAAFVTVVWLLTRTQVTFSTEGVQAIYLWSESSTAWPDVRRVSWDRAFPWATTGFRTGANGLALDLRDGSHIVLHATGGPTRPQAVALVDIVTQLAEARGVEIACEPSDLNDGLRGSLDSN